MQNYCSNGAFMFTTKRMHIPNQFQPNHAVNWLYTGYFDWVFHHLKLNTFFTQQQSSIEYYVVTMRMIVLHYNNCNTPKRVTSMQDLSPVIAFWAFNNAALHWWETLVTLRLIGPARELNQRTPAPEASTLTTRLTGRLAQWKQAVNLK